MCENSSVHYCGAMKNFEILDDNKLPRHARELAKSRHSTFHWRDTPTGCLDIGGVSPKYVILLASPICYSLKFSDPKQNFLSGLTSHVSARHRTGRRAIQISCFIPRVDI